VPGTRAAGTQTWPGDPDFENDCRYVEAQLKELIAVCEGVSGRKFDIDRLREGMAHANAMSAGWKRVLELNQSRPSLFNALSDGTIYLGVSNGLRGTEAGATYFRDLVEEMEYKAARGIGTLTDERYRLLFVGVPCYPIFRRFNELFTEWGGTFVNSTYLWFASGGSNVGFQYDLDRPLESLAEGVLIGVRDAMDSMFFQTGILAEMADAYDADGVVYHPIKSCRTVSTGLADSRRALMEVRDIPSLFIESDLMDRRVVSEAQLKNRVDAFFEGLAAREHRATINSP
jgi:benzoyl-CoA reductase subunit B